jgi:hypothetical protein
MSAGLVELVWVSDGQAASCSVNISPVFATGGSCLLCTVKVSHITLELEVLLALSQDTTISNSCIDVVFERNVSSSSCINYISYFSYHRPNLSTTNQQYSQLTDVTTN